MKKISNSKYTKSFLTNFIQVGDIKSTQSKKKKLKSDVFKGTFIFDAVVIGTFWHIWRIFRKKKIYSFHFRNSYKTKTVRQYYIDNFFFFSFLQYFQNCKYLAILLFYDVNLTAAVAKFPTFFSIFFYKNCFPSPFLSRAVWHVKLSQIIHSVVIFMRSIY